MIEKTMYAKEPVSSTKFSEILIEVGRAIERLEVLESEIKKELKRCAMIGV